MKTFRRLGECNRCGQCCGAPVDGKYGGSPFPGHWPDAIRYRPLADVVAQVPQAGLCGLVQISPTEIGVKKAKGTANIDGRRFPYIWLKGRGLVRSEAQMQCPFLMPETDGAYPCGLVGTSEESAFETFCKPEPPQICNEATLTEWQQRYPGCSYSWEAAG